MRSPELNGYARLAEAENEIQERMAEEQAQAAEVAEVYSDVALREEADAINEQYDRDKASFIEKVETLNTKAELEIFGTHGRTEGYVDPVTGDPLKKPIKGIIDTMRENPRYGTKQSERNAAADKYAEDITSLVDEGFDLAQAKVVMDLRAESAENIAIQQKEQLAKIREQKDLNREKQIDHARMLDKLTDQYVKNGFNQTEAKMLAKDRLGPVKTAPVDKLNTPKHDDEALKAWVRNTGTYSLNGNENPVKPVAGDVVTSSASSSTPNSAPKTAETKEVNKTPKAVERIAYKENEYGVSYGTKLSGEGTVVEWDKMPESSRVGIITVNDGTRFYMKGNRAYDLSALESGDDPLIRVLEGDDAFTDTEVGVNEVVSVELSIQDPSELSDEDIKEFKENGQEDPFEAADKALEEYYDAKTRKASPASTAIGGIRKWVKKFKDNREARLITAKPEAETDPAASITVTSGSIDKNIRKYLKSNGYKTNAENRSKIWDAVEAGMQALPDDYDGDVDVMQLNISEKARKGLEKSKF